MKQFNIKTGVYLLLTCSMLFWGTSYVFTKIVLPYTNPITLIFIRLLISSAMLWIVILLTRQRQKIEKGWWKYLFFLAFFEPFLYFLGETYALERVSPIIVSPMISTIPVFTALTMIIFFNVKLSKLNIFGIIISFLGVVVMIMNKDMQADVDAFGMLLLLMAIISSVGYGLMVTKLSGKMNPVWLIAIQNSIGMLLFLPLWLAWGNPITYGAATGAQAFAGMSPQMVFWACVCMLAVFSSTFAFMFYSIAISKIGVSRAAVFTNLIPIFTAITAYVLTGEVLSAMKMTGIIIIIAGVMLTQLEKNSNIL